MAKKKTKIKPRLVLIEWDDAAGPPDRKLGWIKVHEAEKHVQLVRIRSVGWLIREDDVSYCITPNITSDDYCDSSTAIPKKWVVPGFPKDLPE
jgi:hypothetical protein